LLPIEQAAALQQVQIEIAVAVHVEQRGAASHDLRQEETIAVTGSVHEVDAGATRDVFEPRRVRGAGLGRRRLCRHDVNARQPRR